MRKFITLTAASLLMVSGCQTLNKQKTSEDTSLNVNKDVEKSKDSGASNKDNYHFKFNKEGYKFDPIDNSRPMVIDGVAYMNASVTNNKELHEFHHYHTDTIFVAEKEKDKSKTVAKKKTDQLSKVRKSDPMSNLSIIAVCAAIIALLLSVLRFIRK